jgi:hypothetical protein
MRGHCEGVRARARFGTSRAMRPLCLRIISWNSWAESSSRALLSRNSESFSPRSTRRSRASAAAVAAPAISRVCSVPCPRVPFEAAPAALSPLVLHAPGIVTPDDCPCPGFGPNTIILPRLGDTRQRPSHHDSHSMAPVHCGSLHKLAGCSAPPGEQLLAGAGSAPRIPGWAVPCISGGLPGCNRGLRRKQGGKGAGVAGRS